MKGRLSSCSDWTSSPLSYFCTGNYYLSFLPASEMLPLPLPPTGLHTGWGCLLTASQILHSGCVPTAQLSFQPPPCYLTITVASLPFPLRSMLTLITYILVMVFRNHLRALKLAVGRFAACGSRTNSWSGLFWLGTRALYLTAPLLSRKLSYPSYYHLSQRRVIWLFITTSQQMAVKCLVLRGLTFLSCRSLTKEKGVDHQNQQEI